MADGIIQFIKLALDKASLKQLEQDAAQESRNIANSIARTLQGTGPEGEAVLKYVLKLRQTFEANLGKIRDSVAEGLVDIPKAERQAQRLAAAFSAKLQSGIERLGGKYGMGVGAQLDTLARALPRKSELDVTPRSASPSLGLAASELARAGKQAGNAWAENFAPIVHHILTSDATWEVKAAALMKLGARAGDAWAEGVRERVAQVGRMFGPVIKQGTDATLIELQKNATGYSRWQELVRKALGSVSVAYDALKAKTVDVPDPTQMSGMDRARLRKKFKGDNQAFNAELDRTATLSQLSGAKLTTLGKVVQFFGVNVARSSPQVQSLVNKLEDFGVSGARISKAMPSWANGMGKFGLSILNVAKAFGLYYSARQAIEFLKSTVIVAGESQVAWAQLSTTVADYGGKLSEMMPLIRPVFDEQARLGVSYTDSAKNLARLIQITGDLQGSLRALPVVQDMAASGFMTLEQASKQVGRAMLGDIGSISRYGIFLDKNRDILDQLSKRFGGEQAMKAQTLTGSLNRLSVAWYETKVAMGEALAAGGAEDGLFEKIISFVKSLKDWVTQNQIAIKFLGILILSVFGAFGAIVFGLVNGFVTVFNVIGTVSVGLTTLFKSIPALADVAISSVKLLMLEFVRDVAAYFDQLFNTNLAANFDLMVRMMTVRVLKAKKDINANMAEGHAQIKAVWTGSESDDSRAPDARGNPAGLHIRAREHQRRRAELSDVRANVLSGDTDLRERGLQRLAEIEKDINERMAEDKDNEFSMIQLGKDRAIVEKIRADLEKKTNTQTKEEAKYRREISRLSAIAREADDKQALLAVHLLNVEHDKLLAKRKQLPIGSEAWEKNEANIKSIEDGINGHLEKQDKLFTERAKKLAAMIDLDVNRADAVGQINAMMDEQNQALADGQKRQAAATKGSADYNKALEDQITAKQRLVVLEGALRNEDELVDKRIAKLKEELGVAETRAKAERELLQLRDRLNKKALEGKTGAIRETAARQSSDVTAALDANPINMKGLDREVGSALQLIKHQKTRQTGLQALLELQAKINEQLASGKLTVEETVTAENELIRVLNGIRKAGEPILNMWDSMKDFLDNDLTSALGSVASSMADQFEVAFTGIMRDSRNLGHALNSIPKGFAKAMLQEIGNMAKGKVRENLAWALEETAKGIGYAATGNFAGAGAAFSSAAQHTAAAAAWGLLGGAAGGLGQSASTAYSNATDFASGSRGGSADNMSNHGPDIYLTIDGVDPSNPRHQKLIGDTTREYQERYGGRIVYTPS